ncbi:hypothetical protein ABZW30_18820 [Kitasatospora sp. NPDC004669]|uniref:hypothetical protein n=1 Tax=Kitasatospora sp. NPDC004669 TaxID=3154555 RepID=UPI00339EBB8E
MKHDPFRHRARGRSRKVMALSLGLGSVLTAGAAALGVSFAATTSAPPAQPNMNCTLKVPANPLTAKGLATPYVLSATNAAQGACHEANANQSAFVQATVVDPATGTVSVYNPLVVDKGTKPAAAPVVPALPAGAVVGIWFGFNGNVLTMAGQTAAGKCVGGTPGGQPFGQFAYCNAPAFFTAANAADKAGKLRIPALGTAKDGKPCPTTRDFGVVDQDQSDNVTSEYLATAKGATAQKTKRNSAALSGGMKKMQPTALLNGSDNLLLDDFIDPALGCTPWTAPDLADPGSNVTSLALNELQAAKFQAAPIALVPLSDPMVQENGKQNPAKVNLYRAGVDQPPLGAAANGAPSAYCTDITTAGTQRIALDRQFTTAAASPQAGQNLFDFLSQRYTASLTGLGCKQPAPTPSTGPTPTGKPSPGTSGKPTANPSPGTSGKPTANPSPGTSGKPTANPSPGMSGKPTTTPISQFPPCCNAGQ